MKYHDFWNEVFGKAPDADYYIDVSGRGTGKSTSVSRGIAAMSEEDNQFILISRLMSDARRKDRYFEPETGVSLEGRFFIKGDEKKVVGFNTSLSMARTEKSSRFDNVNWAVFEEFIPVSQFEYIGADEPRLLSNLISTVFRNRPGKVILLGNMDTETSKYNQYFTQLFRIDWDLIQPKQGHLYKLGGYIDGGKTAKIVLFYGGMPFENDSEIGSLNKLPGNDVATTGKIIEDSAILNIPLSNRQKRQCFSFMTFLQPGTFRFVRLNPHDVLISYDEHDKSCMRFMPDMNAIEVLSKSYYFQKILGMQWRYTDAKTKFEFLWFLEKIKMR